MTSRAFCPLPWRPRIALRWRAVERAGEAWNAADVGLDGAWGEVAEGHVVDHAAAQGCHCAAPLRVNGSENPVHAAATERRRGVFTARRGNSARLEEARGE